MIEDIDQLIEINLPLIAEKGDIFIQDFSSIKKSLFECKKFANELNERNLGTLTNERFVISEHGFNIVKNGGWLKFLETEKSKNLKEVERQVRKDKSDEIDLRKKIWDYKYRKYPLFISTIALIGTITSILMNYNISKKKETIQQELQLIQKQIQSLQDNVNRIDSLNLEDIYQIKRFE